MKCKQHMDGWVAAIAVVAAVGWASTALAQPPRGGDRTMEPAWTLQAQGVAKELNLDDAQQKTLVDAYVASRKSYAASADQATGEGRERFEAMMKAADAERETLKAALAAELSEAQVDKAMKSLGSFGRQTDRLVETIRDMNLEPETQQRALVLINGYSAEMNAMRETASRDDWQGLRSAMQDAKAKLDKAMGDVLNESQLATWNQETAFRGRGAGDRGPRGGRGDGAGSRQQQGGQE